MKKTLSFISLFLIAAIAITACSPSVTKDPDDSGARQGTRSYKLDPEAQTVVVSVYGVKMGTPDNDKFVFLMRTLKKAGELSELREFNTGIESGLTLCGVFSPSANRADIYQLLRTIETDSKETHLEARSASNCDL